MKLDPLGLYLLLHMFFYSTNRHISGQTFKQIFIFRCSHLAICEERSHRLMHHLITCALTFEDVHILPPCSLVVYCQAYCHQYLDFHSLLDPVGIEPGTSQSWSCLFLCSYFTLVVFSIVISI